MVEQFALFSLDEYRNKNNPKKRIRYDIPTFTKSYTITSDEKCIFRYGTLQKIHQLIYNFALKDINPFDNRELILLDGLFCFKDELQAEIPGTWELPLRIRLKLHIKLLRLLREGKSIKESLCVLKNGIRLKQNI